MPITHSLGKQEVSYLEKEQEGLQMQVLLHAAMRGAYEIFGRHEYFLVT